LGIAAGIGAAAAAGSLASSVSGLTGGSGPQAVGTTGGNPATYIPQGQSQADALYQSIFGSFSPYASAVPGETIPGLQQYASNIQNNPYSGLAQQGAGQAFGLGQQTGQYAAQGAGALEGLAPGSIGTAQNLLSGVGQYGAGALPYASQVLQQGFDPQSQLYNQLQNQTTQQAAAANSMSGLQGPYAAGNINQADQNFNINWQNQQLGRENTALSGYNTALQGYTGANTAALGGYNTALGTAGQAYTGAGNLGNLGSTAYSSTSQLPYQTYLGQQQTGANALTGLQTGTLGAFSSDQALANLLQSYMGLGQSATGQALTGEQAGFGQQQTNLQNLGTGLGGLSSLFSGSSLYAPAYSSYNSDYGTNYNSSAASNYGYPSFDFSQAG
jgi:hypothetical protein